MAFRTSPYPRQTQATETLKESQLHEYLSIRYTQPGPVSRSTVLPLKTYQSEGLRGQINHGDALVHLRSLASSAASLVFLDPPFNLGKHYSGKHPDADRMSQSSYLLWMTDILAESARILAPGGALFLYHLPVWAMRLGPFLERFLDFRQWIAISMKNGFVRQARLYPAHYSLLMFTKGRPKRFKRPRIPPARCRHCDGLVKDYGGYLPLVRRGINLSDVWDDLSPVRHAKFKHRAANELHPTILERVLTMSSVAGGLYVDPFAGTGSGILTAIRHQMRFDSCDLVKENCLLLSRRIAARDRMGNHSRHSGGKSK